MAGAPVAADGSCDPKFAAVRDAFLANFADHGEVGAAVCIAVDGVPVVDLWGGWADGARARPWTADTIVNFFSIGKGLIAVCALMAVERSLVSLDEPVSTVWPEFAAAGKESVTLRQVLSHQAGLPALRDPLPGGAGRDWSRICGALAAQRPWWEPGTAHGYHVNTFGFLVGEVLRRADGRSFGTFLRDEVAAPLGADVHVGLEVAHDVRVAEFLWGAARSADAGPATAAAAPPRDTAMYGNAYSNPPDFSGAGVVNTREWRAAEIPSTNGHGSARGVARVYAALAGHGSIDGVTLLAKETLAEGVREHSNGPDLVLGRPSRFALGFQLTQPERPLGPGPAAFGHFGAGGSLGFCDPDAGIGFGYVMNTMGPRWQNPCNRALLDALYSCL